MVGVGKSLLGKSIWVNWPHMFEAKVYSIETDVAKVELGGPNKTDVIETTNDADSQRVFQSLSESISDR